jgi:hypothetical protein
VTYTKTWDSRVSISDEMREDAAEDRRRFLAGVYREFGATLYGIGTGTKERWLSKDKTTPRDLGIRVPLSPRQ